MLNDLYYAAFLESTNTLLINTGVKYLNSQVPCYEAFDLTKLHLFEMNHIIHHDYLLIIS